MFRRVSIPRGRTTFDYQACDCDIANCKSATPGRLLRRFVHCHNLLLSLPKRRQHLLRHTSPYPYSSSIFKALSVVDFHGIASDVSWCMSDHSAVNFFYAAQTIFMYVSLDVKIHWHMELWCQRVDRRQAMPVNPIIYSDFSRGVFTILGNRYIWSCNKFRKEWSPFRTARFRDLANLP